MDIGGIEEFRRRIMYLPESTRDQICKAFNSIAQDIVIRAKALCPVRTGRLMHSIYAHVSRDMVLKVGAYAPYALYVEFGTRRMAARLFLTRAVTENMPRLATLMCEAMRLAAQEAAKYR